MSARDARTRTSRTPRHEIKEAMLEAIGVESADDLYAAIPERLRLGRLLEIEPAAGPSRSSAARWRACSTATSGPRPTSRSWVAAAGRTRCRPSWTRSSAAASSLPPTTARPTPTTASSRRSSSSRAWSATSSSATPSAADVRLGLGRGDRDLHGRPHDRSRTAWFPPRSRPSGSRSSRATAGSGRGRGVPFDRTRDSSTSTPVSATSAEIACVYVENPGYLGLIQTHGRGRRLAHGAGALSVVGVDPTSLGVLEAPPRYGADTVCGDLQPLGIHMHFGGGLAGFIATPDTEKYVWQLPTFLMGSSRVRGRVRLRRGDVGAHVLCSP